MTWDGDVLKEGETYSSYSADWEVQAQEVKDVSEDSNHLSNNTDDSVLSPRPCSSNTFQCTILKRKEIFSISAEKEKI